MNLWCAIKRARRRLWKEKRRRPRCQRVQPSAAGACSPALPALPPRGNDDDTNGPPLARGSTSEAAAFEVAALIVD
jgi:hypothetical protein